MRIFVSSGKENKIENDHLILRAENNDEEQELKEIFDKLVGSSVIRKHSGYTSLTFVLEKDSPTPQSVYLKSLE